MIIKPDRAVFKTNSYGIGSGALSRNYSVREGYQMVLDLSARGIWVIAPVGKKVSPEGKKHFVPFESCNFFELSEFPDSVKAAFEGEEKPKQKKTRAA